MNILLSDLNNNTNVDKLMFKNKQLIVWANKFKDQPSGINDLLPSTPLLTYMPQAKLISYNNDVVIITQN